ncbi:hypothetical protein EV426DRAFT_665881 [Tirmania nivea]|nr:hypothetical protein EV426DRAFT_665881 [Tirmania nivea]
MLMRAKGGGDGGAEKESRMMNKIQVYILMKMPDIGDGHNARKRAKDAEVNRSPEVAVGSSGAAQFFVVEEDGSVEDSKTWDATIPTDMRRWIPENMVMLMQIPLTLKEWRAKAKWMVAYVFIRVRIDEAEKGVAAVGREGLKKRENRTATFLPLSYVDDVNSNLSGKEGRLDGVLGEAAAGYRNEMGWDKTWKETEMPHLESI